MNPCVDFCWNRYKQRYSSDRCDTMCDFAKAILENRELRRVISHGKWLVNKEDGYISIAPCSVCGEIDDVDFRYCPNCGAKMDIED